MFCTECGTRAVGAGKFCANCGTKLAHPESTLKDEVKATATYATPNSRESDADDIVQQAQDAHDKGNYKDAIEMWRIAAEQGHAEAQYRLGYMYNNGKGLDIDAEEAAKWYSKAAEQGYAKAQLSLSSCYEDGYGVEKNIEEALKLERAAVEQGYADAQYHLGSRYNFGCGVEENEKEAIKWYRKAAEQGHEDARNQLRLLDFDYVASELLDTDTDDIIQRVRKGEAIGHPDWVKPKWLWLIAAERGSAEAQYELGRLYDSGVYSPMSGVKEDDAEAFKWYWMAAKQGHKEAIASLKDKGSDEEGVVFSLDDIEELMSSLEDMVTNEDDGTEKMISSGKVIKLSAARQHDFELDDELALREEVAALIEEGNELRTRYRELIKDTDTLSEALDTNKALTKNIEKLKDALADLYNLNKITDEDYEQYMAVIDDELGRLNEINLMIQKYIKQERRGRADKKIRDEFWNEAGDLSDKGGISGFGMRFGKATLNALFKIAKDEIREKQGDIE